MFGSIKVRDLITVLAGGLAAIAAQHVFNVANTLLSADAVGYHAAAPVNPALVFLIAAGMFATVIAFGRLKSSAKAKALEAQTADAGCRVERRFAEHAMMSRDPKFIGGPTAASAELSR